MEVDDCVLVVDQDQGLAYACACLVERYLCQPRFESVWPAELVELAIGAQVRFLHYVAGLVVVAHDAAREPEEEAVVPPHDELVQSDLAGEHASDHLEVRYRVGRLFLELQSAIHRVHAQGMHDDGKRFPTTGVAAPRAGCALARSETPALRSGPRAPSRPRC